MQIVFGVQTQTKDNAFQAQIYEVRNNRKCFILFKNVINYFMFIYSLLLNT